MEIYDVLKKDHEDIRLILDELISLREDDDYRYILIEEIRNQLLAHSRAEESVFYNTLRAVNADKKVIFHGYQEHIETETLLRTLQFMDRINLDWKNTAIILRESFLRHVEDEESEIFSEARKAFTHEESLAMAEAYIKLKPKIEKEGLLKNTMNVVMNLLPPRLTDRIRSLNDRDVAQS